jgi:predicted PurR-regulated permease PerM
MTEPMPRHLPAGGGDTLRVAGALIIVSFVLGVLYLGRAVIEPLAMAMLLSLVLAPPIRRLRNMNFGRTASVITVVVLALCIIGALGFVMETQVTRLAEEIPQYQKNLRAKITSLNKALVSSGTLKRASSTLDSLASELKTEGGGAAGGPGAEAQPRAEAGRPIPVEVQAPRPATLEYLQNLLSPLITPLTMGGLLILFLVFILFYREDLRDRLLRLAGPRDLQRTTEAMNDAGRRLSRFFLIQAAINASFGVWIGVALWGIGVPNSVLWGMLAAILRFVPYIGTPIAAVFPLVLAAAIDPGWTKVLATAALFAVSEIVTGQVIEPVLQGQQTGLSPLAIVLAQLFWTMIWGVPGLLLAVPITVCIAVVARHTEALGFLGVVLGDEPALAPHEGFYQRLLAGDATEAAYQAEVQLASERLSSYYDAVPLRALSLAHQDAAAGKLPPERQRDLLDVIEDFLEDLEDYQDEEVPAGGKRKATSNGNAGPAPEDARSNQGPVPEGAAVPVLLLAARSAVDQSASLLLADLLEKRGLKPSVQPYSHARLKDLSLASPGTQIICVSCFSGSEAAPTIRYLIRRWSRAMPRAHFLACFWLLDEQGAELEEIRTKVGAEFVATSLAEAANICCDQSRAEEAARPPHPILLPEGRRDAGIPSPLGERAG